MTVVIGIKMTVKDVIHVKDLDILDKIAGKTVKITATKNHIISKEMTLIYLPRMKKNPSNVKPARNLATWKKSAIVEINKMLKIR